MTEEEAENNVWALPWANSSQTKKRGYVGGSVPSPHLPGPMS